MSVQAQPAERSYPINDGWLEKFKHATSAYVDLEEIRKGTSGYITWLQNNKTRAGWSKKPNKDVESSKANFIKTGLRVGNTTKGNDVKLRLRGNTFDDVENVLAAVTHPMAVIRIYAQGTLARKIKIHGYGGPNVSAI